MRFLTLLVLLAGCSGVAPAPCPEDAAAAVDGAAVDAAPVDATSAPTAGTLSGSTACRAIEELMSSRAHAGQYLDVTDERCLASCPWAPSTRCTPESWEPCMEAVLIANTCIEAQAALDSCEADCR